MFSPVNFAKRHRFWSALLVGILLMALIEFADYTLQLNWSVGARFLIGWLTVMFAMAMADVCRLEAKVRELQATLDKEKWEAIDTV